MNKGLYSLIVQNKRTKDKIIVTNDKINKEKVCISEIDTFTSNFQDSRELIDYLYDLGTINFKDADMYISYLHNGKELHREILYSDLKFLTDFITDNKSKVKIGTSEYTKYSEYIDSIFKQMKADSELKKYILNSKFINDCVKQYITEYFEKSSSSERQRIKYIVTSKHLLYYKALRDLAFVIKFYSSKTLSQKVKYQEVRRKIVENQNGKDDCKIQNMDTNVERQITIFDLGITQPNQSCQNTNKLSKDSSKPESSFFDECAIWISEDKDIKEMVDLDAMAKLSNEEMKRLGLKIG